MQNLKKILGYASILLLLNTSQSNTILAYENIIHEGVGGGGMPWPADPIPPPDGPIIIVEEEEEGGNQPNWQQYYPTEGRSGGETPPNSGIVTSTLAGINSPTCTATTCRFSGTLTRVCTYPNTNQVNCQIQIYRTPATVVTDLKYVQTSITTAACNTAASQVVPSTVCGTRCANCMTSAVACYNLTTGYMLSYTPTTFGCGQ